MKRKALDSCLRHMRTRWDWWAALALACLASWWYFCGTPFVLGLDYFTHLAQAHVVKTGIEEGNPIPAYDLLHGGGRTFIRYQAMLVVQAMGWLCYFLVHIFSISDPEAIVVTGRIACAAIHILSALSFHYAAKKLLDEPGAALVGTAAYLFGWMRLGLTMHAGAVQRAGAFVFYPVCFALFLLWWQRPLTRREQLACGVAFSGCLLSHPGAFILLGALMLCHAAVEICWNLRGWKARGFSAGAAWVSLRGLILPGLVFAGLTAWFVLPASWEKQYFGQHRNREFAGQEAPEVPLSRVLPLRYAREIVDREPWFGNHIAEPERGGSYLGNLAGVNSGYCGISVLAVSLFALALLRCRPPLGQLACRLLITEILLLGLVWWEGLRMGVLSRVASQVALCCRWMEIFYFVLCILASLGAMAIFCLLRKRFSERAARCVLLALCALVAFDFLSLIQRKSEFRVNYEPQTGRNSPLGIDRNHAVFDSYDAILRTSRKGGVLDIPQLLFNCNPIYHGQKQTVGIEPSTDWVEAVSYDEMLVEETRRALLRGPLAYPSFHPCYSFAERHFACGRHVSRNPRRLEFRTPAGWRGETAVSIDFPMPGAVPEALAVFPVYLPRRSEIRCEGEGLPEEALRSGNRPVSSFLAVPWKNQDGRLSLRLRLTDGDDEDSVVVGFEEDPAVLYAGESLPYRLALTDTRFVVINLACFALGDGELEDSKLLRKIHQSRTSALYENALSSPAFLPRAAYLVAGPCAWEFFNNQIAHHPLYNPNSAGFCYEGDPDLFAGTIRSDSPHWQEELARIFGVEGAPPCGSARLVAETLESAAYEIDMEREGFFFASVRYHPNLRANLSGVGDVDLWLAQAGTTAVRLPAGRHFLAIRYCHPWYDRLGKWISGATLFALLVSCGLSLRKARYGGARK